MCLLDGIDEYYSWIIVIVFLCNVVMGEKYVELVGSMNVNNDMIGVKVVIEFVVKGVFGGRGEEVKVEMYGFNGSKLGVGLVGIWINGLKVVLGNKEIWKLG